MWIYKEAVAQAEMNPGARASAFFNIEKICYLKIFKNIY
jgi:hypothetical protein